MTDDKTWTEYPDNAIEPENVLDIEQFALKTGITGDQTQKLIDRIGGNDREALEAAARELKTP